MGVTVQHKKSFYGGIGFIALVLVSNFFIHKLEIAGPVRPILVIGTVLDIVVVIPVVVFLFVLRRKPTVSVFGPMLMLALLMIHWLVPPYAKENLVYVNMVILGVEALLVLVELSLFILFIRRFPVWKRHFKAAERTHYHLLARIFEANRKTFSNQKKSMTFERLSGFLATDACAIRYAVFPHLDRVPQQKHSFTYHKKSEYFGVFLMLVHAMLLEIIAVHVMIMQFSHTAAWVATFLDIYALLFLIGDYQAIRKTPIIIDKRALHIQKGLRFHLMIPLEHISRVEAYEETEKGPEKDKRTLNLTLPGFESPKPQFIVELSQPLEAYLYFGLKRRVTRMYLSVDDSESFIRVLKSYEVVSTTPY